MPQSICRQSLPAYNGQYKYPAHKRILVLKCLVEGMSIRATVRVTGVAKATVMKLLVTAGKVCADYQDRVLSELPCRRVQADEIWSFIYAKEKNVPRAQIADLVRLIDEATPPPGPRGPYRKRENSN